MSEARLPHVDPARGPSVPSRPPSADAAREASRDQPAWDITFLGFVLGHGGDAIQMLTLASGVHRLGARVRIVVPELPTSAELELRCRDEGIPCERSRRITASLDGSRQPVGALIGLLRSLDSSIVHYHTGNSCLPRAAMVGMATLRLPRGLATVHSPYETIEPGSMRARTWAFLANRQLECVVSPSEHGLRFQIRCGLEPGRLAMIHNSFDERHLRHGDAGAPRAQLGMQPDQPMVLFFSRLDPQKRPLDALRAFAMVTERHPGAVLVFAGIGREQQAIEALARQLGIADRVRVVGYQRNVADWLAAATVWILPTERENFSVALLEALAAGCPVLSTWCPGNDEVLDDRNSMRFAIGDVPAAAAALDELLSDPGRRARLAARGRETAARYSEGTMVEAYRKLYARSARVPDVLRP